MKIKTFDEPIVYIDYVRLHSLYPKRGTSLGGTPITIRVSNFADGSLVHTPLCKFSMDML